MRILVAAALLLGACVHAPDPGPRVRIPHPPLEPDLVRTEETFTGAGGVSLFAQEIRASDGEPRAVLVIQHGLKDHGDRYTAVAAELARSGYVVAMADLRGHGRSGGRRVEVERFDDYVADLDAFVARVRARTPDRPVFVLGHSLGGAIVALWAIERQPDVAGIVLSAPALVLDGPPAQLALIRTWDLLSPSAPLFSLRDDQFSSDRTVVAAMGMDPLIHHRAASIHTAATIADGIQRIWANVDRLGVPLLALHGTADRITAPAGSRDLIDRAAAADRTLKLYDGFFHDLLHEPGRYRVARDLLAWTDARLEGPRPQVDAPPHRRLRGDRTARAATFDAGLGGGRTDADEPQWAATMVLHAGYTFGSLGWHMAGDLGASNGDLKIQRAALYPFGVGARLGDAELSAAVGIGAVSGSEGGGTVIPAELAFQAPAGPLHLLARGTLAWDVTGAPTDDVVAGALHAHALVGVRLGRDLRYWPSVRAGRGLYLGATFEQLSGLRIFGAMLGFQFWAAN